MICSIKNNRATNK